MDIEGVYTVLQKPTTGLRARGDRLGVPKANSIKAQLSLDD